MHEWHFGVVQDRTHSPAHEINTVEMNSKVESFENDVKGNTIHIPASLQPTSSSLTWDFVNQLVDVDITGDQTPDVSYEYDVLKRRVARTPAGGTGQVYVYAGEQIVADYERGAVPASTPTYRYVWGIYIDEPILRQASDGEILYYHRNQQYSTTALTNNSGLVVERYAYTAYGQIKVMTHTGGSKSWSDNSNRYLYTGREWDNDTQLYHFRARQYSPHLGRFISRDTLGYVDGMSLYAGYFAVRGLDATGLITSDSVDIYLKLRNCKAMCLKEHTGFVVNESLFECYRMCDWHYHPCATLRNEVYRFLWHACSKMQPNRDSAEFKSCKREAISIASSLEQTCRNGGRPFRLVRPNWLGGQAVRGNWCYEWAYGYEDAIKALKPKFVKFEVEFACPKNEIWPSETYPLHYWLRIFIDDEEAIYVDDGFMEGFPGFAHHERPCGGDRYHFPPEKPGALRSDDRVKPVVPSGPDKNLVDLIMDN